jgi:hypothetical protein
LELPHLDPSGVIGAVEPIPFEQPLSLLAEAVEVAEVVEEEHDVYAMRHH